MVLAHQAKEAIQTRIRKFPEEDTIQISLMMSNIHQITRGKPEKVKCMVNHTTSQMSPSNMRTKSTSSI